MVPFPPVVDRSGAGYVRNPRCGEPVVAGCGWCAAERQGWPGRSVPLPDVAECGPYRAGVRAALDEEGGSPLQPAVVVGAGQIGLRRRTRLLAVLRGPRLP